MILEIIAFEKAAGSRKRSARMAFGGKTASGLRQQGHFGMAVNDTGMSKHIDPYRTKEYIQAERQAKEICKYLFQS
jgi:hypothetical protein